MTKQQAARILDLPIDAPPAMIKRAYRELAKRAHPDAGGSEEAMKELIQARSVMEQVVVYEEKYDFRTAAGYRPFDDETTYEDYTLKNMAWVLGICLVMIIPFKLATKEKEATPSEPTLSREYIQTILTDTPYEPKSFGEVWQEMTTEQFRKEQRQVRSKIYSRR